MQIVIKVLKGNDFTLDVSQATTIVEIKKEIEKKVNIPLNLQKLLLVGRTLNDEQPLSAYPSIKDGTKLNLIVMKQEGLKEIIHRSFRKYYNEQQSERLTREFMLDFETKLRLLSLDDIERLAEHLMCI
ncbi:ubiquitin-like protein 4A [Glossina fuscipes]|uniref:Ubiquitin-like protein 4A n=1 Tax=Glossina fuscipes TaxID=7396 RepID=A0A9C5ZAT6_9MUSC|nr:ubiquitin-like protein 4A [Glossina fuscipes]